MERLQMCRMCLVKDAPMYVVVNRNMHEIYEKLTNKTFVTNDRRPVHVCYFCCSKLKQCCRFQRKCLESEELFAQMLNEDYELNPLINPDVLKFNYGFVKSPIQLISIVGEQQTVSQVVKEELPADFERQPDISEIKEELEIEIKLERQDPDYADVEVEPVLHFDSEDVLLTEFKTEVEEEQENDWAAVAVKAELTEEQKRNGQSDSKVIRTTKYLTRKLLPEFKEPLIYTTPRVTNTINKGNIIVDINDSCGNDNKDNFRCKIPNKDNDRDDVNRHRELCVKEKRYICDICQHRFYNKSTLLRHIRIHHTYEKPYKCEVCQYAFIQKSDLTRHFRIHTNEKPYKCEVCQFSTNQKGDLIIHIRNHTGEKPYKCELCQQSFKLKRYLTDHIRKHTNEYPDTCKVCQYSCNNRSSLLRHIRIHHTYEKPYKCDVCQNGFIQKSDLTRHNRIHTKEKPYKCEVCQYSCNQKGDLIKHIRIHTGEKPYKCDVCQYSCNRNSDLRRHIRIHTGDKLYKCEECQYSSNQKALLKNHSRKHHTEVNP